MKKLYYMGLSCILLFAACERESVFVQESPVLSEKDALESFAKILSKAVYSEPALREYLKTESQQKRDYDTDIFIPWVIDDELPDGRTVRSILNYYDSCSELEVILRTNKLITILVPDWSWVDAECFCPNNWDTSINEVAVSFSGISPVHDLYLNGKCVASMSDGEFVNSPILIVKTNDHLVYSNNTKTGCQEYSFICDDFVDLSGAIETKSTSQFSYYDLPYDVATDSLSIVAIDPLLLSAYATNTANNGIAQRDVIYYGLNESVDSGYLRRNIYEELVAIRLNPDTRDYFDDQTENDEDFDKIRYDFVGNKPRSLTISEMIGMTWGEGAIELSVKVLAGSQSINKIVSVPFGQAFAVKKIRKQSTYNWLGALKANYYSINYSLTNIDMSDWLEPKWIPINYELFNWDISQYPKGYIIEFSEKDSGVTTTETQSYTLTFLTNYKRTYGANIEVLKLGYEYGVTATYQQTYSNSISYTENDDQLGSFVVQFGDKVIRGTNGGKARMKVYSTGCVDAFILPYVEYD